MGKLLDAFNDWFEAVSEGEFTQIWEDTYEKVSTILEEDDSTSSISYSRRSPFTIKLGFQTKYEGSYALTQESSLDDAA